MPRDYAGPGPGLGQFGPHMGRDVTLGALKTVKALVRGVQIR